MNDAECLALGAGEPAAAVELVETTLAASEEWAPRPLLALAAVEARRRAGRGPAVGPGESIPGGEPGARRRVRRRDG